MTEPLMPERGQGRAGMAPGTPAASDNVQRPLRSWQVLLTWMGADPPGPDLHEELGNILDRFPNLPGLSVETAKGPIMAARDFSGDPSQAVTDALRRLFKANPEVTGVCFPASGSWPEHTATPDAPLWPPPDAT